MRTLTIGQMLRALVELRGHLPTWQQSFILSAAERSKQGSDTSLLSDKDVEQIAVFYQENFYG